MHDLNDLRVFERVATLGSYSAAAAVLSTYGPNASRAIRRLEQSLGVRLLERVPREVVLTDVGRELLDRCRPLLDELADALAVTADADA